MIQALAQSETTSSFGYWVRRQRQALDLTQAELARRVNCATVTISKIERDERRPSRQMANLLANCLAISVDQRDRFLAVALGELAVDRIPLTGQPLAPQPTAPEHSPPSNLPTPSTPFVGRKAELKQLATHLEEPSCRLLTLLGAGGFGKTRLAIRLGELVLARPDRFPDGVFFVALNGLESAELVVPAIAAALDFTFYEQQGQESQLLGYLAGKRLLLILDNAEEILDPDLVARMLSRAPAVKTVVTTREALNLQQEWFHPIGGMSVGALEDDEAGGAHAEDADAIALFQQCAQRARPDFDLASDLVSVQRICRLVDGAPLAIELAAAWLRALPCEQVARELTRSMDFLSTTLRDMPARHRNMRAVLEQSWHYLTGAEQRIFRRLSVFEGSFRPDAAQAIVDAPLQVLATLVEKSMLQLGQDGRYRIHALLRQLGAQKLADHADELAQCQARHSDYFLAFLADRRSSIVGPDQHVVLREIQEDLDNIRTAWLYVAGHGRLLPLRGALRCLFRFLWMRGRYEEGAQLATQALAGVNVTALIDEEQGVRVALMAYGAQFAATVGANDQALSQVHVALADAIRLGNLPEQAHCHYVIGLIHYHLGNRDREIESLWSAYALFHELDDTLGIAETAPLLGYDLRTSDFDMGRKLVEEGLQLYRTLGDRFDIAAVLNDIAAMHWAAGEPDQSEKFYQESLEIAQKVGNRLVIAKAIGGLGAVAWARQQWDLAISLMQQRLEKMQHLGCDSEVKLSLDLLCGIYADAERYADAISLLNTHPEMWRTPWTAQAQVGTGAFEEVMRYLPQMTVDKLATNHAWDRSRCLIVWTMVLGSECGLSQTDGSSTRRTMSDKERQALASEILSALRSFEYFDSVTRKQVDRLLARLRSQVGVKESAFDDETLAVRPVQELAQELLTIRLG